jgi:lysophospholipase L1-like esterase
MQGLNHAGSTVPTWVANAGFSGHTTVHTLAVVKTLPAFESADVWLIMGGINDFQSTLEFEGSSTQRALEAAVSSWFHKSGMWLIRTRLARALRRVLAPIPEEAVGDWYGRGRAGRAAGRTIPMPDLTTGLSEYRERLLRLADECRDRRKRCVFMTQPTIWRADLPQDLEKLLWFGWVGRSGRTKGFASVADLARGMSQYNDVMLMTCGEAGMECLDLAAQIPKDTTAFFDDCHFNIQGAQLVADAVVSYLSARPPYELKDPP